MDHPEIRIMVYGDSNILARFSNFQETFSYKLQKYAAETLGKKIEVVNAGVAGYGPDQCLIKFEREADRFKPQLVILGIFADNDFGDIIRNRLFEFDSQGRLVRNTDPIIPGGDLARISGFKGLASSLLIVRATKKIFGVTNEKKAAEAPEMKSEKNVDEKIQKLISLNDQEFSIYKASQPRVLSLANDHYDMDVALFPKSSAAAEKIRLMDAILTRADRFARTKNIKFLVLIQPSQIDLTTNGDISYKHLGKFPEYSRTNLTKPIEEICVRNGINYINLFKVFLKNGPDHLYRFKDNHWSDEGQDLAAKTTLEYLIAQNLVK